MNPFEPDPSGDVTRLPAAESGGGATGDVAFTDTSGALSIQSDVADGAGAIAFSFSTTEALATSGAKLATIANNGSASDRVAVNRRGGLEIGDQTTTGLGSANNAITILRDAADGYTKTAIYASFKHTSEEFSNFFFDASDGLAAQLQVDYQAEQYWQVLMDGTTSAMFMAVGGTDRVALVPSAGASSTAYKFDTGIEHTSGNLVEIKNHGSVRSGFNFAGSLFTPSVPPANASAAGVAGTVTWDADFIYVCTATNAWKRAAIATWP